MRKALLGLLLSVAITNPSQIKFTQNGTGAASRSLASKLSDTVSVLDFGAKGDGTTDDTASVQACLNSGAGAPVVCEVPPTSGGYKLSSIVTLAKLSALRIRGTTTITTAGIRVPDSLTDNTGQSGIECTDSATLKLAASANVDLIANTNFAALSGSGNSFGTFRFFLRGCRLDGNKANQAALVTTTTGTITNVARSAGGVVTITLSGATTPAIATGMTVNISNVTNDTSSFNGRFIVQSGGNPFTYNQVGNAIGSAAATGSSPQAVGYSGSNGVRVYGRAGAFESLTVANNVLDGMWHEGRNPGAFTDDSSEHEVVFRSIRLMNSGGDGMVFWGPDLSRSFDTLCFGHGQWGRELFAALQDSFMNSFLNGSGSLHIGPNGVIQQGMSVESSAAGWGILVDNGTGPSNFAADLAACNGCIGLEVRTPGHVYQGSIANSVTGVKFGAAGGAQLSIGMNNNTTWFDVSAGNAQTTALVASQNTTGTLFSGTPTGVWLVNGGDAAHSYSQFSGVGLRTSGNGNNIQIPASVGDNMEYTGAHAITYSTSMTPAGNTYGIATITATDGVAFTINAPATLSMAGHRLTFYVKNTSGGALGAATWNATYKLGAAWTQPATGNGRLISFIYNGTNWIEENRSAADVPN